MGKIDEVREANKVFIKVMQKRDPNAKLWLSINVILCAILSLKIIDYFQEHEA